MKNKYNIKKLEDKLEDIKLDDIDEIYQKYGKSMFNSRELKFDNRKE